MWTPRRWVLAAAIVLLAATFATPTVTHAEGTFAELCGRVSDEAADAGVKMGIVVIDLATDARCEVNADETFRTASLYKLVVLAEAYRQAADGTFDFSAPIDLEPRHAIDDPPDFRLTETVRISNAEAASRMIRFSDNASAAALRERLGYADVAAEPARLGMTSTVLSEQAFESTPRDMAHLIEGFYRGSVVSAESSRGMIDLLKQQEITDLLPVGLPSGTEIAHKTGTLDSVLHDAGVIYAPAGDYVVVAMTEHDDFDAAVRAIRQLSRTVFDAYSGDTPPFAPNLAVEERAAATRLLNEPPAVLPVTAPIGAQVPAVTGVAAAEEPIFIESSGSLFGRFDAPVVPAVALATLLLMPAMVFAARIWTARRGRRPVFAEVESRLLPARRDPQMRFGGMSR
ncbi:MAG: class A beta-lactamase-related serine hydrolase [Chloroflexi bacterium]|nr:class A beta-lactamase-related serine hydrolase [Chloroflexota bacterium]